MPHHLVAKSSHRRAILVLIAITPVAAALWLGCGLEQAMRDNYAFWNKFIDGIPDPDAVGTGAYGGANPELFIEHAPFAENTCMECHSNPTQSRLTLDDSHICLKCHEEKPTEYSRMHGPVAVGACLWCHDPHSSPLPHLLRAKTPDLCLQCHSIEDGPGPHADQEEATRACLDCHKGHGSNGAYYLLPGATLPIADVDPDLDPDPDPDLELEGITGRKDSTGTSDDSVGDHVPESNPETTEDEGVRRP